MKQRFEKFLNDWIDTNKRDTEELKELFLIATGKTLDCSRSNCISAAVKEVRKYYALTLENQKEETPEKPKRKYKLIPGNHQITNGPAINNSNTNDKDIEFYLKHYPHIKKLLVDE